MRATRLSCLLRTLTVTLTVTFVTTLAMAVALSFAGAVRARAHSADYPNRPVKMIVGFAAGGGTDVVARIMAQKMSESSIRRSWWRTGPAPAE